MRKRGHLNRQTIIRFISEPLFARNPASVRDDLWPKVTIITPSFNQGQFLEQTILSVLNQNYPNLEYLVLDGGSLDSSVDTIRKYAPYLAYWTSEPDKGQSDAINRGLKRATGDIIAWINSDDFYLPGAIQATVDHFRRFPDASVVSGFRLDWDESTGTFMRSVFPSPTRRAMQRASIVAQETVFFRRCVLDAAGLLDDTFHHALDWEYWNRILAAGYRFTVVPRFQAAIRRHPASKTSTQQDVKAYDQARIYRRYLGVNLTAQQALRSLGARWWLGYYLVRIAGYCGIMDWQRSAKVILSLGDTISGYRM